jgi:molybdopterin molybdotransferase
MLSVKEAQARVLECEVKLKSIKIDILKSCGKVIAEDIISNDFIPAYDNSAMDGFAVRAVDIIGADKNYPVKLKLIKEDIPAGKVPSMTLESGFAVPIMTGAPIPSGCDCIVMKEDALKEGRDVLVFRECGQGENIRCMGEDINQGDTVLKAGKKIYPADIGVMASIGLSQVNVYKPPLVGILSTGDELVDAGQRLSEGKVRDSNSYSLAAQAAEAGADFKMYGIAKDDKNHISEKISFALGECDLLLISGGVSIGDYDFVKEILADTGAEFVFWRVNQRPGKPLAFLTYKDKFIFALPGNPVSVMVCFEMYARPLIKKMMGECNLFKRKITARALQDYQHKEGRTDFIRAVLEEVDNQYYFKSTSKHGSGNLTSMAEADGLAVFPDDRSNIFKEEPVDVYLLRQ